MQNVVSSLMCGGGGDADLEPYTMLYQCACLAGWLAADWMGGSLLNLIDSYSVYLCETSPCMIFFFFSACFAPHEMTLEYIYFFCKEAQYRIQVFSFFLFIYLFLFLVQMGLTIYTCPLWLEKRHILLLFCGLK